MRLGGAGVKGPPQARRARPPGLRAAVARARLAGMNEPIPLLEDWRFWQIIVTGLFALVGFFLAAWVKYGFDLRLDARRRKQERIAVAVEVQAAMVAVMVQAVSAKRVISGYRDRGEPMPVGALVSFELPQREFLHGAPGQLGVLGPDLCFKIAQANMWLTIIRQTFAALQPPRISPSMDAGDPEVHATSFAELAAACQSAVQALEAVTGKSIAWKPPELGLPGSEAAPE